VVSREPRSSRGAPPWWPAGQPWPPSGPHAGWRRRRQFFLYRVGGILVFAIVFGAIGLSRLIATLAERAGVVIPPQVIAFVLFVGFFAMLLLFLGGMRRVGMPLGDIVSAADRVGSGDYSAKLVERGPPFLRSVARAFNAMTTRLERQEQLRRDLMADVAHELRTPLSVMRGRLEGILDGVYQRDDATLAALVDDTKLLERLVEDLRTLAHAEGGTLQLQKEATDLAVLIGEVLRQFTAAAEKGGIDLQIETPEALPLAELDPLRMREVLGNLVANALRYTPRGGRVTVAAARSGESIALSVTDTGAGIAPDDLAHVFDRFAKGDDSSGSGLGLAIARRLAEAHGGSIAAASAPGAGTTMTVRLPLGDAA
jgi:two-component system OmpR family sensor kinase/two-component system sensor histidine kinase BaeS